MDFDTSDLFSFLLYFFFLFFFLSFFCVHISTIYAVFKEYSSGIHSLFAFSCLFYPSSKLLFLFSKYIYIFMISSRLFDCDYFSHCLRILSCSIFLYLLCWHGLSFLFVCLLSSFFCFLFNLFTFWKILYDSCFGAKPWGWHSYWQSSVLWSL